MKVQIERIERPTMSDTPRVPIIISFSDDKDSAIRYAEIIIHLDRKEIENKTLEDVSNLGLSQAYKFLEDILCARPA
jgi:hypothetical protein